MTKPEFLDLLDKYLAGNASVEEEQMLLSWYRKFQVEASWDQELMQRSAVLEKAMWQKIAAGTGKEAITDAPVAGKVRRMVRWVAAACILFIVAAGGYWWYSRPSATLVQNGGKPVINDVPPGGNKALLTLANGQTIILDTAANGAIAMQGSTAVVKQSNGEITYNQSGESSGEMLQNTMSTPRGGQYRLTLPDGTKVWLNAASAITYPTVFAGGERKVKISGEAYFEVAKNAGKPFVVDVDGRSSVEVLGTHFNINSYTDEDAISATLLEGSIRVHKSKETVLLKPGQQAQIRAQITVVNNASIEEVMAWKDGYFHFHHTSLRTVMRQLSRWYDVEVDYEGNPPNDSFEGELPMDANASQVLTSLQHTQVHFRIEGKRIIVTP